jgi:cytidyltransferase-like protein
LNRIALVGGVFDPLHGGHVAYLEAAKAYGTLVCALSDAPEKHPPLVPIAERAKVLQALGVTRVIEHGGSSLPLIIEAVKPAAYVKGGDWAGRLPDAELAACARVGASVVFTDGLKQSSSFLLADYEARRAAEKLADFETFVQTQPDQRPWSPVTPYDRESRRQIEAPQADILAHVFAGCSVLDYGCGFGFLVELLRERGMFAVGWDPQFRDQSDLLAPKYDAVICREVLEHVPLREWPDLVWALVDQARRFIYVTTRFTAKSHPLDVEGSDHLDPTHISITNQALLRTLFALHGCRRRDDLEEQLDWRKLGRCLVYEVGA